MFPALLLLAVQDCQECHIKQAQSQVSAPMAQTLQIPLESRLLQSKPSLAFSKAGYTYRVLRNGSSVNYSVSNGNASASAPLAWAVGYGATGQTFLFQRNGTWYESAISFYPAIQGLDWTPGHAARTRRNLDEALGRKLDAAEVRNCFGCHSTDAVWTESATLKSLTPGVACSQCHRGAEQHAGALKNGQPARAAMAKLGELGAEDLSAICSNCHPSWAEVAEKGPRGVGNVRHQVYRLTSSRCYDTDDRRISCAACHDPHGHNVKQVSFYDAKCQNCHSPGDAKVKRCPVSGSGCITCHMPKVEVPELHSRFTDHRIRIARPGEKYPD
ncbi:MAG: hypothetical protein M3Z85_05880 [Acidobacteriota bacterium]|nr:hypothetical protein [Acidobacteriota bacterium]